MKRTLFNLLAAVSLLLSVTAAAAWAISLAWPLDWHLLAMAHSPDLKRVDASGGALIFMRPVENVARYGYWDALWARSRSGSVTLVAHAIDYEDPLRGIRASPPSLIVDLPGPTRARAVAFGHMPESDGWARRLGFAWHRHVQQAVGDGPAAGKPVSVQARMIAVPYWFLVLLGLPLWLRRAARRRMGR